MMPKLDRRVQRTRQLLRDSLITLILEKGYDAVTVQDITDRANLGRATFYLHYRDKEELLISSLEETFDELVKTIGPMPQNNTEGRPPILIAFEHASQNRDLYRVMLSGQGAAVIGRPIHEYLVGVFKERLNQHFRQQPLPIPVDIVAHHMAGSLLSLLTWWIESDTGYSPEYMARAFQQLTIRAMLALLQSGALEAS
jgi:AcrR family transcriptional regulator